MVRQIINAARTQGRDPLPDIQQAIANAVEPLKSHLKLLTLGGKSAAMPYDHPLPNFYSK